MTEKDRLNTPRIMLDIETLGTEPGSVILSIGAVGFTLAGIHAEFHRNISLKSCQQAGLEIDAETLDWWLGRDEVVQDVLTGGQELQLALEEYAQFHGDAEEIWAHSPAFDCVLLRHAYDAVGIPTPWQYWHERDCRTLADLPQWPDDADREGDEHDALDDAWYQARQTIETLRSLTGVGDQQ